MTPAYSVTDFYNFWHDLDKALRDMKEEHATHSEAGQVWMLQVQDRMSTEDCAEEIRWLREYAE